MANNIAIYSPHTTWDVVQGGVNDWLASAFGEFSKFLIHNLFSCTLIIPFVSEFSEVKPLVIQKYDVAKSKYILTVESSDHELLKVLSEEHSLSSDLKLVL